MSAINYRPEIDGLRALAVIPVVLFHLNPDWLPGGYAGVDVFFVISGFLITSIILKDHRAGKFSFHGFWARRVRRILPVVLAMVLAVLTAEFIFGYRNELQTLGVHALSTIFSVANISMWRIEGDYWGGNAENSYFLHCWSLSVEEQFYLIYPLLLAWLLRKGPELRRSIWLISVVTMGSLLLFIYASSRSPSAAFYLLPTRAWELGGGALLALALGGRPHPSSGHVFAQVGAATGLLLIITSYFVLPEGSISAMMILPVVGAVIFIRYANEAQGAGRLLSRAPFVYIGRISFSLYVWHWPMIIFAKRYYGFEQTDWLGQTNLIVLMLGVSWASYAFVESPLRRPRTPIKWVGAGVGTCAILAVVFALNPEADAYDTSRFDRVALKVDAYNVTPTITSSSARQKKLVGVDAASRAPADDSAFKEQGIFRQYGSNSTPEIIVVGDSHGAMWSSVVDDICRSRRLTVSFFSTVGENPFFDPSKERAIANTNGFSRDQRLHFEAQLKHALQSWRPIVVIAARWSIVRNVDEARDLIEFIGECGGKVVLIEQPPEVALGDRNSAQYLSYLGIQPIGTKEQYLPQQRDDEVAQARKVVRDLANGRPYCSIVESFDLYDRGDLGVVVLEGDDILYYDDDHLSDYGAFKIRGRLDAALASLSEARMQ